MKERERGREKKEAGCMKVGGNDRSCRKERKSGECVLERSETERGEFPESNREKPSALERDGEHFTEIGRDG